MATIRAALTEDRAEHVQMIIEEHTALVRMADQKREQRMASVLSALEIPNGVSVRFGRDADGPALTYEGPDISPATEADGISQASEKSTAPVSAGDP